jgi:abhydrolase domain-containing protein 12
MENIRELKAKQKVLDDKRSEILNHRDLLNFGTVDESEQDGRKVVLVKALAGGHDYVGAQEGVQDIIGTTFYFF